MGKPVKKIVLLTNEMTPYRKSFYDKIYDYCKSIDIEFSVITMTKLQKGYNWNFNEVMAPYVHLMKGIHLSFPISMHINIEVRRILRGLSPDILIMAGSYMNPTSWLAMNALKDSCCRTYFWSESHLNEIRTYNNITLKIRDYIRRKFYSKFNGFWYAGQMSKSFIDKYAPSDREMYFVPNLIDNERYHTETQRLRKSKNVLLKKWGVSGVEKTAVIPARLSKEKGIDCFFNILKSAKNKDKLLVLIPGTGPIEQELKKIVQQHNLNVRFLGYQQQTEMIELYALADIFILPSLSDPNPLTCVEALWCGLPLYVSNHVGNYPEVVAEGVNGYVFSYQNMPSAIEKLDKIISATADWHILASKKSNEIATEIYNPNKVVTNLVNNLIER